MTIQSQIEALDNLESIVKKFQGQLAEILESYRLAAPNRAEGLPRQFMESYMNDNVAVNSASFRNIIEAIDENDLKYIADLRSRYLDLAEAARH